MTIDCTSYGWQNADAICSHEYLLPVVMRHVQDLYHGKPVKIVDLGCGNGFMAGRLAAAGHAVTAVDVSPDGIEIARSAYPTVRFETCSVYVEQLPDIVGGAVECVVSMEVIEHLLYPRRLLEQSYRILRPGGFLILTTPYHGYIKNLALSVLNQWDQHFSVDRDGGHIKFFSKATLAQMACQARFRNPRLQGIGRFAGLWKSIVMVAQK